MNLILACLWFAAAVGLWFFDIGNNGKGMVPVPMSGVCLVLGIYNLVRWWSVRMLRAQRNEAALTLPKPRLRRPGDDVVEPDPNFVFTDKPPAAPAPPPGPAPPGMNGSSPESK